jgi:hypothetical protein
MLLVPATKKAYSYCKPSNVFIQHAQQHRLTNWVRNNDEVYACECSCRKNK